MTTHATTHRAETPLPLAISAAALIGFGATFLLMSLAYMRDLEAIRRVPETVWLFVCGAPTQEPATLPLLIAVSAIALLLGVGIVVIGRMRAAR